MPRYSKAERVGVTAVAKIVVEELGWIFREQPIVDMGIDAHIELVDSEPTGKLIGLQIKTGESHFREQHDSFTYYGDLTHLEYWLNHSLPVILVAYLPQKRQTYWVHVTAQECVRTDKRWKIAIPKSNKLGVETIGALSETFEGSPGAQRFRKLTIDLPLMKAIKQGQKVSIELEEWINKSLGRTTVHVYLDDEKSDEHSQPWQTYHRGYELNQLAELLYPWARAQIDDEFYENNNEMEEDWRAALQRATDRDNFGELTDENQSAVYPYAEVGGEIQLYRFKLELNDLGEAFVIVAGNLEGQ